MQAPLPIGGGDADRAAIRGRVSFSQARNTPFQGLAADGAKLALWRLVREGFRVVGFIHDEILIELPDEGGYVGKETVDRVEQIMCSEMERVLGGTLPVGCEATLSTCWSKEAALIEQRRQGLSLAARDVGSGWDDRWPHGMTGRCLVPARSSRVGVPTGRAIDPETPRHRLVPASFMIPSRPTRRRPVPVAGENANRVQAGDSGRDRASQGGKRTASGTSTLENRYL